MIALLKYNLNIIAILASCILSIQTSTSQSYTDQTVYTIKGSVKEKDTFKPYKDAKVFVNGRLIVVTSYDGKFIVQAKIGDELMVSHDDFETVYYTITSNERISIEVKEIKASSINSLKKQSIITFNRLIDSADLYLKQDAEKSIQFIGDALKEDTSSNQNASAHELLGDVYSYWKQFDLAISAYKISLQNNRNPSVSLKLAKSYLNSNNSEQSITTYNGIETNTLSKQEQVLKFEGLGNTYLREKKYNEAINNFQEGLRLAEKYNLKPKITDLNSKIAQTLGQQGLKDKAKGFFSNSLNLAAEESSFREIQEKVIVAEFNNTNKDYTDEINLRKQVVEDIELIERDSLIPNESPLTLQKQNYKIGNALILQNNYEAALPFLDKSIKAANDRGDLEVKNDALRKKVDAYENLGDFENAKLEFEKLTASIDSLYILKQQEISRAARFSRNISEQQIRIATLESDKRLSRSKYELTNERNKRQQLIIYSLLSGLILLLIAGFFMFKYIKQQRLANNLLALKSLRSQMNPHFIFNALNSVNSFIASNDERAANKYLSDFSRLMRSVLENSEEDFISLMKEIELISLYTKLEHFRFKDKFDYHIDVDSKISVNDYQIPPMLLQPYIENAVWHGLRYKTTKGQLIISIKPKDIDCITISIIDDGIGRERSKVLKTLNQKKQVSKGMHNIRRRVHILNNMYQDKVDITIENYRDTQADVGTKVEVTLKRI